MAAEAGGEQMVLILTDLVGVSCNLVKLVRERLVGNDLGLDIMKVRISTIHTNAGPPFIPVRTMRSRPPGAALLR